LPARVPACTLPLRVIASRRGLRRAGKTCQRCAGRTSGQGCDDRWCYAFSLTVDIPDLESAALPQRKIPDGKVTRIEIGRQKQVFPNNRDIAVAVHVSGQDTAIGHVYCDASGRIVRTFAPR
jgi:hypothetical protein